MSSLTDFILNNTLLVCICVVIFFVSSYYTLIHRFSNQLENKLMNSYIIKSLFHTVESNKDNIEVIEIDNFQIYVKLKDNDKEIFRYDIDNTAYRDFTNKECQIIAKNLYKKIDNSKYHYIANKNESNFKIVVNLQENTPY